MNKRIVFILLIFVAAGLGVWIGLRFARPRWQFLNANIDPLPVETNAQINWYAAAEEVKADRSESAGNNIRVETPPELKHYTERHWFLATQVAEVAEHKIHNCQDYMDLAAMIQRGEVVAIPAVTDSYILFGIGQRADDDVFSRYEPDDGSLELDNDTQPNDALQTLAKNFGGRSYDINNAADRQAMKVHMLSSLRPAALKIMEEVASAYHRQFGRRLPVSSLMRPEQYQRALRRVNRNAVLIETPPHSTGLAFDIDYRYMPAVEQMFVMGELARIKREGRIEVIRERNANYHVFAFIDGMRPSDDLITASLEEARGETQQAHHAPAKAAPVKSKTRKAAKKSRSARPTTRKSRKRR
ncbi:MAG TPA: DUF5715 family protein [Pyrinomonadaceae bacterium]|nr:DUF5715 family protein [Pyrinomonadaceae bacterium]